MSIFDSKKFRVKKDWLPKRLNIRNSVFFLQRYIFSFICNNMQWLLQIVNGCKQSVYGDQLAINYNMTLEYENEKAIATLWQGRCKACNLRIVKKQDFNQICQQWNWIKVSWRLAQRKSRTHVGYNIQCILSLIPILWQKSHYWQL